MLWEWRFGWHCQASWVRCPEGVDSTGLEKKGQGVFCFVSPAPNARSGRAGDKSWVSWVRAGHGMWRDGQLGTQPPKTQGSKAELRGREVHAGQSGLSGGEGGLIDKRVEDIAQWWSGAYRGGGFSMGSAVSRVATMTTLSNTLWGTELGWRTKSPRKGKKKSDADREQVGELRCVLTGHVTAKLCSHRRWAVAKPRAVTSPMAGLHAGLRQQSRVLAQRDEDESLLQKERPSTREAKGALVLCRVC